MSRHGLDVEADGRRLAAEALRADAELVDLFEHLFFKVCIERVRVLGIKRAHERLLCKQRCFIKRAADAYADDHRRARVRACGLYDLKDKVLDALQPG